MACRIIFKLRKYDHVSDHLSHLHWLKVRQCIIYKTLMLVFKCKQNLAPPYLHDLLNYTQSHHLSSTDQNKLPTVKFNTALVMKILFYVHGSISVDDLPTEIRCIDNIETFETSLKIHLFWMCYCTNAT